MEIHGKHSDSPNSLAQPLKIASIAGIVVFVKTAFIAAAVTVAAIALAVDILLIHLVVGSLLYCIGRGLP